MFGEHPRGWGGRARGGRSRPGQGSRCAEPEAWAPGAFPAGAELCRRRRRRRCCWSRCRCWNSRRDHSMFLSALSPQLRHPASTPPRSYSRKPTPRTSRQAPAANPDKGTPLVGFTPPTHPAPTPRTPSHPQFSGSRESGTIRAVSACPAPAGAYARAPSCSGWFLRPVPPSSLLRPVPTRVPAPLLRPPLSPALGSLLRPFCFSRSGTSCVRLPPALPPPWHPLYLRAQFSCGAERVLLFARREARCSPSPRTPLTV